MEFMNSTENKVRVAEWLRFNSLEIGIANIILDRFKLLGGLQKRLDKPMSASMEFDADEAWSLVAKSLYEYFPDASAEITQVRDHAPRGLTPNKDKHPQSFTYQQPDGQLPYISCHYRGRAVDLIHMAHEFSHALQIVASGPGLMPPVAREVCAFIGEQVIIDYSGIPQKQRKALKQSWLFENSIYLGRDLVLLETALGQPETTYDYRWNYPIARIVAIHMCSTADNVWPLFKSGEDSRSLLNFGDVFAGKHSNTCGRFCHAGAAA
jgi:hypothetical protein